MEELIRFIKILVAGELDRANKQYQPYFNTAHEAYAVTLEELEEAEREMFEFRDWVRCAWEYIKSDDDCNVKVAFTNAETYAIHAAAEMIQVAAMCRKAREGEDLE